MMYHIVYVHEYIILEYDPGHYVTVFSKLITKFA